jgi:hypothetical protein
VRNEIGSQLRLRRKQAINWDRCDRRSGCFDAKLLGQG